MSRSRLTSAWKLLVSWTVSWVIGGRCSERFRRDIWRRRHRRPADLAERLEQLLRERVVERLVFGMPLHADDEARAGQAHRLDLSVGRDGLDPQTRRRLIDPLPVQRIDHDLGTAGQFGE